MKKILISLLMPIFVVIPQFSFAVGTSTVPTQQQSQVSLTASTACPTLPSVADDIVQWGKTVGWKKFWAPVVAIWIGIFFWRGGSLTFRGIGLKGRRDH